MNDAYPIGNMKIRSKILGLVLGKIVSKICTSSYCVVLRRYNVIILFETGDSEWTR